MFNKLATAKVNKPNIEDGVYNAILVAVEEGQRVKFNTPDEKEDIFKFRFLIIGPENQDTELVKIVRKPAILAPPEGNRRPSGLYDLLCDLAGRELTAQDLKTADEMIAEIQELQVVYRLLVTVKDSGWADIAGIKRIGPLGKPEKAPVVVNAEDNELF